MNKNHQRYLMRAALGCAALALGTLGAGLCASTLGSTEHGVHTNLYVPLGPAGTANFKIVSGTGDRPTIPGFLDGPVVTRDTGGGWLATWFCEDHVEQRAGTGGHLTITCGGLPRGFDLGPVAAPETRLAAMPAKVVVLSDIEGNLAFLDAALRKLEIVDSEGKWRFGGNRLVIVGDSVDRGREAFGVLWRLYGLTRQAQAAGGAVHTLIGNHEQYILRGNVSRAHPEHIYALQQMGGEVQAFAPDTVIGAWLRAQPVLLQMGPVLFTHGGISREVAAQKLTLDQINQAMWRYWGGETGSKPEFDAVLGQMGVSQYRGYLMALDDQYGKARDEDVAAALDAFGASQIVVGHTLVDKVSSLYGGRVFAVDVNTNDAASEVLVYDNGVARVVDIGVPRELPAAGARAPMTRPLRLGPDGDWPVLRKLVARSYALSQLPHPY